MANQSKLKAWLRYDGTGRVVTAGPIFSKNKPKDGNWKQMNANLCCNGVTPSSSTTTTTTQGGGGGSQGIPYELLTGQDAFVACAGFTGQILYFASAPGQGQVAYLDQALTIPYTNGYINRFGDAYGTNMIGVMNYIGSCSQFTTTTTTQAPTYYNIGYLAYGTAQPCANQGYFNAPLILNPNDVCFGGAIALASGTWANYNIGEDQNYYVNIGGGLLVSIYIAPGGQVVNNGCVAC